MSKVIVTGGAGMIGSHCVDWLINHGHDVLVIDDLSGGVKENVHPSAELYTFDITEKSPVDIAFRGLEPDYVIHCAAFASENLSNFCPSYTANNICVGTSNLMAASVKYGVKCFVSLSSIASYGHQEPPFTEDTPLLPMDAYGAAKQYTESLCRAMHNQFGLNYVVFRPHNVVGTRQNMADSTRNVVSIFIRQAMEGKPLTIYGDGSQTRAFSPISQVAPIIASSIFNEKCYGQAFNIGGEKVYTVLEIAKLVSKLVGVEENFQFLPERREAKHAHSDHSKIREYFDIPEGISLEDTIKEMIEEARSKPLRPIQPLPPIEIEQGLPENWR